MNRRTFLQLLGIGVASAIPAVNALAGSGAVKRAKLTIDRGYEIDDFRRQYKKECVDIHGNVVGEAWYADLPNVTLAKISESVPSHRLLSMDKNGCLKPCGYREKTVAISCVAGNVGTAIPVRMLV